MEGLLQISKGHDFPDPNGMFSNKKGSQSGQKKGRGKDGTKIQGRKGKPYDRKSIKASFLQLL